MEIKRYVVGFIFDLDGNHCLLLNKKRPAWQMDMLNGVGGKIEENESALNAMIRECEEEVNLKISTWYNFCELKGTEPPRLPAENNPPEGQKWSVEFFYTFTNKISQFKNNTSEIAEIFNVKNLPENILPNLNWLVPMAKTFGFDRADKLIIEEIH